MVQLSFYGMIPFSAGVIFLGFAFLFLFRAKKDPVFLLCAALFSGYGIELVISGLGNNLQGLESFVDLLCFIVGVALAPTGSFLIIETLGRGKRDHVLLLGLGVASVLICVVGIFSIVSGGNPDFYYTLAYGIVFVSFCVVTIVEARELRPLRLLPRQIKMFFLFTTITIVIIGTMMLFRAFGFMPGVYILSIPLIITFSLIAGSVYKNVDVFLLLESQNKNIRYSRSSLSNIDVPSRIADLEKLMRKQELFRDENISLDRLAEKLDLTPHQLSELLNLYVGKTFSAYVLGFRIEQAMRELVDSPKETILDIAFSSGFSSKSTFNAAFRKETGLTPSAYRKHYFDARRGA